MNCESRMLCVRTADLDLGARIVPGCNITLPRDWHGLGVLSPVAERRVLLSVVDVGLSASSTAAAADLEELEKHCDLSIWLMTPRF